MDEARTTPRCAWCGQIETDDGWRAERRKRPVPYSFTTCVECAGLEEQLTLGKHVKAKAFASHGARQNIAFNASRGIKG